jgi:hypothetical protein
LTVDLNDTMVGHQLAGDQPQYGGLADTTGPHDGHDAASRYVHADMIEDQAISAVEYQVADSNGAF